MTDERMLAIILEISNGNEKPEKDTPQDGRARVALRAEIDAIKKRGGIVDIPGDFA